MTTPWRTRESLTTLLVHLFDLTPNQAHQSYLELGHQVVWAITAHPALVNSLAIGIIPRQYRLEESAALKALSCSKFFMPLVKAHLAKRRAKNLARVEQDKRSKHVCSACECYSGSSIYLRCAPNPSGPDEQGFCADFTALTPPTALPI